MLDGWRYRQNGSWQQNPEYLTLTQEETVFSVAESYYTVTLGVDKEISPHVDCPYHYQYQDAEENLLTFSSADGNIAASINEAQNFQFYYGKDGCIGFCLRNDWYPDGTSVGEGYVLDGWQYYDGDVDEWLPNPIFLKLGSKETRLCIREKVFVSEAQMVPARIELTFGETQTAFDFRVYRCARMELVEKEEEDCYRFTEISQFEARLNGGELTNDDGDVIPFTVDTNSDYCTCRESDQVMFTVGAGVIAPYVCQCYVIIDADAFEDAAPGVYIGTLEWTWSDVDTGNPPFYIPLTLTVPLPAEEQAAVDAVIALIDAIGEVTCTAECKAKINAARRAYNALNKRQKPFVANVNVLENAEYDYLAAVANAVVEKIDAIGEVTCTAECKAKIDEARAAYNALLNVQKVWVKNYPTLTAAEDRYAALEAAAGTSDPPTISDPPEPKEHALGDVDGDGAVTPADARLALRASVRLEQYEPGSPEFLAADVDGDGTITPEDARMILRAAVRLITLA